jgi:hypothetical protein
MAQKTFGRRQPVVSAPVPVAGPPPEHAGLGEALALAEAPSRSAVRSLCILAAAGVLVVVAALGAAYAVSAAMPGEQVASEQECRARPDCANRYRVTLSCGTSDGPKPVEVLAADAEAAARKAERYHRECRAHGSTYLASVIRTAAVDAHDGRSNRTSSGRVRWRFRLR